MSVNRRDPTKPMIPQGLNTIHTNNQAMSSLLLGLLGDAEVATGATTLADHAQFAPFQDQYPAARWRESSQSLRV
jgi:hypothetical protein